MEQSELNEERILQNFIKIVCPRLFEQLAQTIRLVNIYNPYKARIESKKTLAKFRSFLVITMKYHLHTAVRSSIQSASHIKTSSV